jgi:acetyl esterase/lipase
VEVDEEARAEARATNDVIEAALAKVPSVHTVDAAVSRRVREEQGGLWGPPLPNDERAVDRSVPGPDGPITIRQLVPPSPRGVVLHIHGGGFTLGSERQQDPLLAALADRAQLAVVSVGYRLAPEDPFPAGPDDCEAAALWLIEHAADEFGTDRLQIAGESAGAHLAALTLLRLRDRHDLAGAFDRASLLCGWFDLGLTPSVRAWGDRNLILSGPIMQWFADNALPGLSTEERRHPSVSPLWADLSGLPPAQFQVGDLDPLLDDSLFMAARWEAAGNETELLVYPDGIHGFNGFPIALASLANRHRMAWFRGDGDESSTA